MTVMTVMVIMQTEAMFRLIIIVTLRIRRNVQEERWIIGNSSSNSSNTIDIY